MSRVRTLLAPAFALAVAVAFMAVAAPARADDPIPPLIIPKDDPPPRAHRSPALRRGAPTAVVPFRGQYCGGQGPRGWIVTAENAQRVAFGADFLSQDGKAAAGYTIFGGGALAAGPGGETPDRAVATSLSSFHTVPTQFSNWKQLSQNTFLIEFQNQQSHGVAFYEVFPAGGNGFMILMRTAVTGNTPQLWPARIYEAAAVSRSIRCNVPNVPPAPDPPSLNHREQRQAQAKSGEGGDDDTLYNRWLEKEYYHNSSTGENYWVSPSEDWVQNGPQGAGYYAHSGNDYVKLDPGYAH
jgi:hypothetical protein